MVSCFAPDAAFGPGGTLYVAYTSFAQVEGKGIVPDSVWLVTSSDGGRSFAPPEPAGFPVAFQLRLAADPGTEGRLYLSWLQADGATGYGLTTETNPVVVAAPTTAGRAGAHPFG